MVSLATVLIFVFTVGFAGVTEAAISGVEGAVNSAAKKVWSIVHKPKTVKKVQE
jgi:hypothetical protein